MNQPMNRLDRKQMLMMSHLRKKTMSHSTLKMVLLASALFAIESMSYAAAPTAAPASAPSTSPTTMVTVVPTPATTQPTAADDDEQTALTVSPTTQISLNFKDAPIDAVLEHLSAAAGFIVIKDAPVTGRITVFSKQPVSPAEAAEMLNSVLKVCGNTAIQMGRILKITSLDKAKKSSIPVHFGADPAKIAQTDELITQVIPVRSVDAVKLKTDLQPLVSTSADLSANGGSNTIIITDTSANIRRVVEIISSLDTRDALENTIRVKQMKYADATAAAKLVTEIFNADQNKGQTNAPSPAQFFRNMRRGGQPQAEETQGARTGKVIASADQRTNTIVVTGPADTLKVIDGMLEELDANPAADQAFFIYSVKNGQSQNMAVVLNNLFGAGSTSTNNNRVSGNNNVSNSRGGFGGNSSSGFGNSGRAGSGGFGGTSGGFGGNTPINRVSTAIANVSPAITNAASQYAGQVYVVADVDTNSLLVSTASKYQTQVRDIITELDRPVPQVLIKVLIAEVTHNNSEDLGVDFSILNTRENGHGSKAGTSFLGSPTPSGGLVVSMVESNVTATLRALAVAGKLDVLSRPYILASDNQLATITVGKEVPIITDSRLDINNNPVNQITYRDLGIILNVTPHINPEGLVILDVSPEVSDITDQTVPISSTVNAPVFSLRSADTRVGINDGQTIVIGGLMQDQKTQQVNKVPILGDIPLIGLLFQRNQITKTKTELLIFLTPHVASAPDKLMGMSQDEMKGVKLVPNAVQPGTFKEHLDGMRRGDSTTQPSPSLVIPDVPDHRSAGSKDEPPLPGTR